MARKPTKKVKRFIIEVTDYSDEFGDIEENIGLALEYIEGIYAFTVKEENPKPSKSDPA